MEIYVGGAILHHIRFGQGQDVLFLHGWGGSTASFSGVAKALSPYYCVTVIDFYGFGESPNPDYPLFVEDYAKAVVEIINHYKMNRVLLVGHSFGGRVAIRIASKYGYLLDKVVLVDSAGVIPRRGILYCLKVFRHKILRFLNIPHEAGSRDYRALSPLEKETFKNVVKEDLTPEMHRITLPVLLIWGNQDKDTPIYMAKRMRRKMPNSALIVFKNAGHFSYLDGGLTFVTILESFFREGGNEVGNHGGDDYSGRRRIITVPLPRAK